MLGAGTLPPNPQELLSRPAFSSLRTELESSYDVVLYDSAAFSLGSDALALAARTCGVLLVARKNHTPVGDINAMTEQMLHSGAQVVGSVLVDF